MEATPNVRLLNSRDYAQVLDIFCHYVSRSHVTPESNAPTIAEFTQKLKGINAYYPFLVCELGRKIVGYGYASKYRVTSGNQWSVETAIYFEEKYHGKGHARMLYEALLSTLTLQNFVNVYAGIVLPNDKSVRFHEKLNFKEVGVFNKSVYKYGRWYDVLWMQLKLGEHVQYPAATKSINNIIKTKVL